MQLAAPIADFVTQPGRRDVAVVLIADRIVRTAVTAEVHGHDPMVTLAPLVAAWSSGRRGRLLAVARPGGRPDDLRHQLAQRLGTAADQLAGRPSGLALRHAAGEIAHAAAA